MVGATNPCGCGYFPDLSRCRCDRKDVRRYLGKISQPLLDRIDLAVEARPVTFGELTAHTENESSAEIRARVVRAHTIQTERFIGTGIHFNSRIPADEIGTYCALGKKETHLMEDLFQKMNLTARTYHKVLKVARTIADLAGSEDIKTVHLTEAVMYRNLDKRYWEDSL